MLPPFLSAELNLQRWASPGGNLIAPFPFFAAWGVVQDGRPSLRDAVPPVELGVNVLCVPSDLLPAVVSARVGAVVVCG